MSPLYVAVKVWVPGVSAARVMLAVEGEPTCTATVPAAAPSSVKVTVPEGSVDPTAAGVMLTDTGKVLPSAGVVVDGVTTVVVAVLATVNVTLGEIYLL